ncbi:hypothetical protein ACFL55_01195 [Candidatus Latescibacterota bacterium]
MRKMELMESIERFVGHFQNQLVEIEKVELKLYKKILYVNVLDTLSKTIRTKSGNRHRFVSIVKDFSG